MPERTSGSRTSNTKKVVVSPKKLLKLCGIMFVAVYAAFVLISQQATLSELNGKTKPALNSKIAEAKLENEVLQDELEKAQNDENYIEQIIRENLGYVKPNERVFIDISLEK